MIKANENALICDFAETYHIFNYKDLPPNKVAILAIGLRDNSRIKMALSESHLEPIEVLLTGIFDSLNNLVWLNSSESTKGLNKPTSLLKKLMGSDESENVGFSSAEEFEKEREKIILKIKERG